MVISLIAAMDRNRVIGRGAEIPWQLPADRRHFRDMTVGKPVVMGRKTFETLKRPLGKRRNIILTRNREYVAPTGCVVVHSVSETLACCAGSAEVMICGGAPVYAAFLPHATRLYLTEVHASVEGDVYFPIFDRRAWREVERTEVDADAKNRYAQTFLVLEKKEA